MTSTTPSPTSMPDAASQPPALPATTASSSSSSVNEDGSNKPPSRPRLGTRKSSGTIIVPREHPVIELQEGDEVFDEDDARTMSPRRNSEDIEKMSKDARAELSQHAKVLQESLLEIFNRIEAVKEEHDKLDNHNKFLQKYIGDLMSTSKITSTGANGRSKR
ncbi:hypothetical protein BP5796_10421 [Coleophoma crateriformis]|uniref:BZIP transcription factor n=1 Tax=Coleophoma crateriformis TaxID=565419 RepID=A0A3D8QQ39_9HELO|nr:hypothetical protein BP5796_10421 [Coleophoma crateriformis]